MNFEIDKLGNGHVKVKNTTNGLISYFQPAGTTAKILNGLVIIDPLNTDSNVTINPGVDTVTYDGVPSVFTTAEEHCDLLNEDYFFDAAGSSGAGGTLPAGTANGNNLQWNDTIKEWVDNPFVNFGYYAPGAPTPPGLSGSIQGNFGSFSYGNFGWSTTTRPYIYAGPEGGLIFGISELGYDAVDGSRFKRILEQDEAAILSTYTYAPPSTGKIVWEVGTIDNYTRIISDGATLLESYLEQNTGIFKQEIRDNSVIATLFEQGTSEINSKVNNTTGAFSLIRQEDNRIRVTIDDIGSTAYFTLLADALSYSNSLAGYGFLLNSGGIASNSPGHVQLVYTNYMYTFGNGGYEFFLGDDAGGFAVSGVSYSLKNVNGAHLHIAGLVGSAIPMYSANVDAASQMLSSNNGAVATDPFTLIQPVNSLGLGGKNYTIYAPNTAYSCLQSVSSLFISSGTGTTTLDIDTTPAGVIIADCLSTVETLEIPTASERYKNIELICKKIGTNNFVITSGVGDTTLEGNAGAFGDTYTLGGTNSSITLKCIFTGAIYLWIVY